MLGLMQDQPLLVSSILAFADRHHGRTEIVSRTVEGDLHRYTYHHAHARARQLANALRHLGIARGERVATLAWNGYRHLELYYAVSGMGAVLHTINPRLHPDQIAWIANHAEDRLLCFDSTFLPIIEAIAPKLSSCRGFVMLTTPGRMPEAARVPNLVCYETLVAAERDDYEWPSFDEHTASSLCYTSGTTGHPKGALYSHRSTVLHALASVSPNGLGIGASDTVMPVVPMFHVNAWGIAYSAPAVGAKLVLPGPHLDGRSVYELMEGEGVSMSAGVPTVWLGLLDHVRQNGLRFSTLRSTVIGGAACPPAMIRGFQEEYGVDVRHAWGMTEMSPLGTVCTLKSAHAGLGEAERFAVRVKQGAAIFGVDMKIVDGTGRELPWDGRTSGDLHVRGPWVIRDYFRSDGDPPLVDGWFPTGDVATIDADGYMQITDRSKDVIKSGGEWISSIDLENIAVAHPAVAMAACIAMRDPKWDERPLLVVVRRPGAAVTREELLAWYEGKVARWWVPDDVAFVDAIPLGATGKVQKNRLREQFRDHRPAKASA
jgi:fatty-acyl-CoA synthase